MKANVAPEKIYLQPSEIKRLPYQNIFCVRQLADNSIEYTRTDAFIEKACEWLDNFYNEDTNSYLIDEDIEKFINYMKGE